MTLTGIKSQVLNRLSLFCAVTDVLTLVQVNSAIVERLWSMYKAMFPAEASRSGQRHRHLGLKARFDKSHS